MTGVANSGSGVWAAYHSIIGPSLCIDPCICQALGSTPDIKRLRRVFTLFVATLSCVSLVIIINNNNNKYVINYLEAS